MKKINETYIHEETGIQFDIKYDQDKKKVRILTSVKERDNQFIFDRSNPETIIKVANALLEIGNFCKIQ